MAQWGLLSTGFYAKPLTQVALEVDSGLKGILGDSAGTNPDGTIPLDTMAGQLKAFVVDAVAAQWDLQQAVYSSFDPTQTTGAAQDAVYAISGIKRGGEEFSTVVLTCTGVPGTTLLVGRVASVTGTGTRFDSEATAVIGAALPAWHNGISYPLGFRVTVGGNVYQCIHAGTSGSNWPTSATTVHSTGAAPSTVTDGGATWIYLGQGTGAVDVTFSAEQPGPLGALAGTLENIATPVSGWQGVVNVLDATVGTLQESDTAFRARREQELAEAGASTSPALRAAILDVNKNSTDPLHQQPTSCTVFANNTDSVDVNGLPGHSLEFVVLGGTDQDIANTIWANTPGGIGLHGNQTSTVIDSEGVTQTVYWSRPIPVPIYIVATVYYDPAVWTDANAAAEVVAAAESAILTAGLEYPAGKSVRSNAISAAIFDGPQEVDTYGNPVVPAPSGSTPMPGVVDTSVFVGTATGPTGTLVPLSAGARQLATFSSGAQLVVNAVPEIP